MRVAPPLGRAGAALWAVAMLGSMPAANAVPPPSIDGNALPAPAPPAPSRPTEQQEPCIASAAKRPSADATAYLHDLDLPAVWKLTRGAGQTVAVIDTGVSRHRLLPRLVPGGDYVSVGDGTDDCDGHGTVVAGIIAAVSDPDAGVFFTGTAPESSILAIRQSSNKFRAATSRSGSGFGDVDTLAMAIRTAADLGATVINVSSVACVPATDILDDRALGAALAYAVDVKNVVVVAAAGNVGRTGQCPRQNPPAAAARPGQPDWENVAVVTSPGWYDDLVLTVGSVGPGGDPSEFSAGGPWVDVAAPGESLVSVDPGGDGLIAALPDGDAPISGTSYAAPIVSGIAALIRARWPQLSARQVMRRIEESARRPPAGWNPLVGNGIVDPLAAVGGAEALADLQEPDGLMPAAPAATADQRPVRVAFTGAAICLAVIAVTTMSVSATRSRRGDAVTHH